MKSIYVGNLPWTASETELSEKFSEFGAVVSARVVSDKFSGKSRGFAFVDMEDSDADKAIAGMNGYKWGDRELTVNAARPKSNDSGGRREYSRF